MNIFNQTILLLAQTGFAALVVGVLVGYVLARGFVRRASARELMKQKEEFISIASHYLLNPIAIIQSATESLQERGAEMDEDKRQKMYEAIHLGEQRLWILAEQILLVSEIDNNDLRLKIKVSQIEKMVLSAVQSVDSFARAKNLRITVSHAIQELHEARFDERRMRQAVIALLDNAIKFSQEGSEIIVSSGLHKGMFFIEVNDQGIGMSPEVISHISEKFYRGSSLYAYDHEGLGLGLHIAMAIARLHQGNVSFISGVKKGTRAILEFPQA